ncbi:MAG TPA: PspC domain-containing protein [Thermoleophilaceae bacterium]|jgi:phage shock protein PspC (stress-responsive transcriptional regulator)
MTTAQQSTPPPPEPQPRRLVRSRKRMIAGVGGGLGRYFGIDPVIFRIALVALLFFGGSGIFVYAAMWLFVPAEDATRPPLGVRFFAGDRAVWKRVGLILAVVVGSALAAAGSFWATGTGSGAIVAGVVIVLGLALVAAALRGGARWLILPALAVALPAGVVSAADVDLHGGTGERTHRPHSIQDMREGYRLGMGDMTVDLRDVKFPPGDRKLDLEIGTGHIELIVPADVCVVTKARVGAGYVGALDRDSGGLDVEWDDAPVPPAGVPRLVVDADVGIGAIMIGNRPMGDDFQPGRFGSNEACSRQPAR